MKAILLIWVAAEGMQGAQIHLALTGKAGKPLLAWGKSLVGAFLRHESHQGPEVPAWVTS